MRVDAFHYDLDPERIAQRPSEDRETARLMVLGPGPDTLAHRTIADLADLVPEGSVVVVNDTRVLPARLFGTKRGTGGKAEILLLRRVERPQPPAPSALAPLTERGCPGSGTSAETWSAIGRASKGLKQGAIIDVGPLEIRIVEARLGQDALLTVELGTNDGTPALDAVRRLGHVPLPPYIRRTGDALEEEADAHRYQTMFARVEGAVAAPTAGLHLTPGLVERLVARGCRIAHVTLHVGLGTFQPVTADDLDQHVMHSEWFELPEATALAIADARERSVPVVAIGTTVVRALESAAENAGAAHARRVNAMSGDTRLLIQPGYRFRIVDVLLTNLHLPRSTLLALVCAFGGTERVMSAYRVASRERYRFFSYGDAMLVWPGASA